MKLTKEQREILAVKIRLSPFWNDREGGRGNWIDYVLDPEQPLGSSLAFLAKYAKIHVTED